mmetsp:Transcript_75728/g.201272  ORF Transcript_75728/g.201272 Transcript_75728/m.201272 type:complete len:332 (-) Transcript_75728:128-1123(-)
MCVGSCVCHLHVALACALPPFADALSLPHSPVFRGVGELRQRRGHTLPAATQHLRNVCRDPRVVGRDERVCGSGRAGAAGAADAVNVRLAARGTVVVDHVPHVPDVQPALGHVSGDQHRLVAVLELLQHPVALLLRLVAVEREAGPAVDAQFSRQRVAAPLRAAEDEQLRAVHQVLQEPDELGLLGLLIAHDHVLVDERVRLARLDEGAAHLHQQGAGQQEARRERLDLRRPRRREHERLAVGAHLLQQPAQLRLKAEVQHAVGLVDHDVRAPRKLRLLRAEQIGEPAGCRDQNLGRLAERLHLWLLRHAAVDADGAHAARVAESDALLVN